MFYIHEETKSLKLNTLPSISSSPVFIHMVGGEEYKRSLFYSYIFLGASIG